MTGPRLTLSGMLGIVALLALGLGAMRSASVYWVSAVSWVLLVWLCAGLLGAIFRHGTARVFWIGFAVFGWVYLLIVHTAMMNTTYSAELSTGVHQLIEALFPLDHAQQFDRDVQHDHAVRLIRMRALADLYLNFGFAALGGYLALRFAARDVRERVQPPAETTT